MKRSVWSRLSVVPAETDGYAAWYREVLEHAGFPHTWNSAEALSNLDEASTLLLCGDGALTDAQIQKLVPWLESGGTLVASGGTWSLDSLFGVSTQGRFSRSKVVPTDSKSRIWPDGAVPATFFGGPKCSQSDGTALASSSQGDPLVVRKSVGKGEVWLVAPHVGMTAALMQMGRSVECDAVGPTDGSATLADGRLRAEDGTALSFEEDRSGEQPTFEQPHADVIKELWLRVVLAAVETSGAVLPVFWHWPNGASGAAAATLECDGASSDGVFTLRKTFDRFGVRACWLVTVQGYPLDVYRAMRRWDDEIGLLYLTDDNGGWNEEKLKIQSIAVGRLSSMPMLLTIRPSGGRWRGWTSLYEMAETCGARISVSKGGRQSGTSGNLFGTCHPFFPVRRDGSSFYVAELPYSIWSPGLKTPEASLETLVENTALRYGCLNVAAGVGDLLTPAGSAALLRLASTVRQHRLEWATPGAIYQFEKSRRSLRVQFGQSDGTASVFLISDGALEGLTVMLTGGGKDATVSGRPAPAQTVHRYGTAFTQVQLDMDPKSRAEIQVFTAAAQAA